MRDGNAELGRSGAHYPVLRMRRLRGHERLRALVRETQLGVDDLVMPLFVRPGEGERRPIGSMPGQYQLSIDEAVRQCRQIEDLGIPAVILFGIPQSKDPRGSEAYDDQGIVQRAVRAIKAEVPGLLVITDVCFCEFTDHGHCGVVNSRYGRDDVDNDATLKLLVAEAVSHVRAGADVVAPSGMMDGMIAALRSGLDGAGFEHIPILSYAAKYASAFYGPFRDAAESAPRFGDRRTYQMDPANGWEALREVRADVLEGADMLMVKPALAYLDVVHRVKSAFPEVPLAAYNVSGEYAMIKAAARQGWIDERTVVLESLTSIKRAGADFILTYFAMDVARWLGA